MADPPVEPVRPSWGVDAILVVVCSLLAFYLLPVFLSGVRLPLGSDASYYVWMTRLAGHAGLADAGFRAGAHGLLLATSKGSGLDLLQAIAPLDVALEIALGLAAAALATVVLGYSRARFVVVGVVTSAYAARMATGYLANLLFMVVFLAAVAVLLLDRRRSTLVLGTAMLVAAGLSHGPFLAFGVAVLLGAVVLGRVTPNRGDATAARLDERRILSAIGVTVIVMAGLVLTGRITVGGSHVLHSGDSILRTLGFRSLLHAQYRQRFPGAVNAAGLAATVPLAAWGAWFVSRTGRTTSRPSKLLLVSWAGATAAGVAAGYATGWFPPGRVLGVAAWLPALAAVGALGIAATLTRRRSARTAFAAVLVLGLLVAPFRSVLHSNVTASPAELRAVAAAGHFASTLPEGTPLVYLAQVGGNNPAFQVSRYENVTRAGLPADRIRDVHVFVGGPDDLAAGRPGLDGDAVHDAVARLYARRAAAALRVPHAVFLLQPLDQRDWAASSSMGRPIGGNARVLSAPLRHGTRRTTVGLHEISPLGRLGFAVLFLAVFFLIGLAVVRWVRRPLDVIGVALAPAIGAGVVTLGAVAVLVVLR